MATKGFHCCENCVYWTGAREINGALQTTRAIQKMGKCINKKGYFNLNMSNIAKCNAYEPLFK
ncbi:MAG: hypothetical protein IJL52_00625 [Clostridia bacterium]|nr:hypothetical protein [Clostridia bacterium]